MLRNLNFGVIFCLFLFLSPLTLSALEIQAEEHEAVAVPDGRILRFATWNIKWLGDDEKQKRDADDLRRIADVLSKYHFIAIVELMHKKDLDVIMTNLSKMGRDYGCLVSPKVGWLNHSYQEYYAFLYDKELVSVVEMGELYPGSTKRNEGPFNRSPYWATFRAGKFDFSVIAVHIYWGDRTEEKIKKRQEEVRALGEVYKHVQKENKKENDILLVGDFNRNLCDYYAFRKLMCVPTMTALFNQKCHESTVSGNLYDNILFQEKYLTEYLNVKNYGVDKSGRRFGLSDHHLIWAEFSIDNDDDSENGEDDGSYDVKDCESTDSDPDAEIVYYTLTKKQFHPVNCSHLEGVENKYETPLDLAKECYKPCSEYEK